MASESEQSEDLRESDRRPRLVVVSFMAEAPFSPRGIRTRTLLEALRQDWKVELVAGPMTRNSYATRSRVGTPLIRKIGRIAHSSVLLDKYEFWSRHHFRSWLPDAGGALLVGSPFSPLIYASRRLAESSIPYVVDVGDPWVLTAAMPDVRSLGRLRGRAAEYRLWTGAAGAVVTTHAQAQALRALFPRLRILVRPNGFAPADHPRPNLAIQRAALGPGSCLRLAHFGDISSDRVGIASFLERLARTGSWSEVEFHQYGSDWTGALGRLGEVRVVFHETRPWSEIVSAAARYDLAVVVGNRDPALLPSKAVVYLQLPIPRLALVGGATDDALTQYVADKPGWTVVSVDGVDAVDKIQTHLSRRWTAAELAPPATESWVRVTSEIRRFLDAVLNGRMSKPRPVADLDVTRRPSPL
jgi:Glycosyl transferase 4-like domain